MLQLRRRDIHIIAYRKPTFNGRTIYIQIHQINRLIDIENQSWLV